MTKELPIEPLVPEEPFVIGEDLPWKTEQTELSAVAKTAIYTMDVITALANRIIRWLDKAL